MHDKGDGVLQDYVKAIKYYTLATEQGHAAAQCNLALMYKTGKGVPQDDVKAIKYYTLAAEQGDAGAQYNLGIMHNNGEGVPQDFIKATKWCQLAAVQGHADAIKILSILQERNMIPQIPLCITITTILLSSEAGAKFNNRAGVIVVPTLKLRLGRAAVLLEGESKPISLKLMNLTIME